MKYVAIDKSKFPVIALQFGNFEPSAQQFEEYLDEMQKLYESEEKYVIIFDSSKSQYLSTENRIKQGVWMKKNDALTKEKVLGLAFVVPSIMIRMLLNAIFLIQKPSVDYKVCTKMEEAVEWAEEKVASVGR